MKNNTNHPVSGGPNSGVLVDSTSVEGLDSLDLLANSTNTPLPNRMVIDPRYLAMIPIPNAVIIAVSSNPGYYNAPRLAKLLGVDIYQVRTTLTRMAAKKLLVKSNGYATMLV